jgi:hypothetical protein
LRTARLYQADQELLNSMKKIQKVSETHVESVTHIGQRGTPDLDALRAIGEKIRDVCSSDIYEARTFSETPISFMRSYTGNFPDIQDLGILCHNCKTTCGQTNVKKG